MSLPQDFLYELLPAFIRNRDFYQGQPLRALMEVLEIEYRQLWQAAERQYDDWFIETCQADKVAAIGQLLAVFEGAGPERQSATRLRPLVASSIAYRRRKGVPAALQETLAAATGWVVRVQPLMPRLVAAPFLAVLTPEDQISIHTERRKKVRPIAARLATVDLRNQAALETLGTPFERVGRINSVFRPGLNRDQGLEPAEGTGYNLTDVEIAVWRLTVYPSRRTRASWQAPGCYHFHPLGVDTPLFNRPQPLLSGDDPTAVMGVPEPLTGLSLKQQLGLLQTASRRQLGAPEPEPPLEVLDPTTAKPIPASQVGFADLSTWQRPASLPDGPRVVVDPRLGRLAFAAGLADQAPVEVSFHYGFAADLGGGPYFVDSSAAEGEAEPTAEAEEQPAFDWQVGPRPISELRELLAQWAKSGGQRGRIRLSGEGAVPRLNGKALGVDLRGGRQLSLELASAKPGVISVDLVAIGDDEPSASKLVLAGLWLERRLELRGALALALSHCTLSPSGAIAAASTGAVERPGPSLILSGANQRRLAIERSIVGAIYHRDGQSELVIRQSIVDGGGRLALAMGPASGGSRLALDLAEVTILGETRCSTLTAESVIFAGGVATADSGVGSVRHCWVPEAARTPPRFRCPPAELPPVFSSRRYGRPGYAQLASRCPEAIRRGAVSGAEIGAFEHLQQAQRETALAAALAEYLPVGLTPRIVYVT